jgi:hypothetical protein
LVLHNLGSVLDTASRGAAQIMQHLNYIIDASSTVLYMI